MAKSGERHAYGQIEQVGPLMKGGHTAWVAWTDAAGGYLRLHPRCSFADPALFTIGGEMRTDSHGPVMEQVSDSQDGTIYQLEAALEEGLDREAAVQQRAERGRNLAYLAISYADATSTQAGFEAFIRSEVL